MEWLGAAGSGGGPQSPRAGGPLEWFRVACRAAVVLVWTAVMVVLLLLGALEVVERPERRQPALLVRQVERRQVDGLQREHRVVLEADMGEGLDATRRRNGQSGERPAVIEAVPDEGRKLRRDAFAGRRFHEAMQGTDLGECPCQAQPTAQAQRGRPTAGAQERSTIHGAYYTPQLRAGRS